MLCSRIAAAASEVIALKARRAPDGALVGTTHPAQAGAESQPSSIQAELPTGPSAGAIPENLAASHRAVLQLAVTLSLSFSLLLSFSLSFSLPLSLYGFPNQLDTL